MCMRTRITRSLTLLFALSAFAAAAKAVPIVVYTDNPTLGFNFAWTINNGLQVEDYFTVASPSTLVSAVFGNWLSTGDTASTVDWAIVGFEGSQVPICGACSGTANLTGVLDFNNGLGYDIYDQYFSLPNITLAVGDYWLELQNEVVSNGDLGYWDANGGPSPIWESVLGDQTAANCSLGAPGSCSDAFTIFGAPPPPPTPEPGSLALLGSALTLLAAELRRRRIL